MTRNLAAVAAAIAASLAAVAPARADVIATFDGSAVGPSSVFVVNATTGARLSAPPGVNEPGADEFHPSLSPDGRFLVFERRVSGTLRIVMVERATGRSADLFNGFEAAADPPSTPTFSLDGTKVLTGRRLDRRNSAAPAGALQGSVTETDVTNFPNGPFPHRIVPAGGADSTVAGRTLQAAPFGSNLLAFGTDFGGGSPGRITVQGAGGATTLTDATHGLAKPTISGSAGAVVFESAPAASPFATKLVFRPLARLSSAATIELPAVVNASGTFDRAPTFTRDGRFLVFARAESATAKTLARLFMWDTQTQLLVNPAGTARFPAPDPADGAIALENRRVLTTGTVRPSGTLGLSVATKTTAGLIVQRIVGRHDVLGHDAPRLTAVGRVPLGRFRRGRHHRRWDFTVRGHELPVGCYLVTFRALTRDGRRVRDLSTPNTVRVRDRGRPLVRRGVRMRTCGGAGP